MATAPLNIPDAAFAAKTDYFERPSKELVTVIKDFIERFGTPHLWPGHTHTKPEKGSRVTFLAKYSLPKSHHQPERWAPCPCCSPHHPKYFRQGLIAWFPDEGVIRCVGDKCYKKMDPEGYELAMKQLNMAIEAERTADFLLTRIPRIPEYTQILESNLTPLAAIDEMLNRLLPLLDKTFALDLWPAVKTGVLRFVVIRREVRRAADGEEEVRTFADFENYGAISGYIALRPGKSTFASRLRAKIRNLEVINFGSEALARITTMTETEKRAAVKILTWAHKESRRYCGEAEEARRFFSRVTLATINGWSQKEGAITVHFAMDQEGFYIARDASQSHSFIKWPENFWNSIKELEPLTRTKAA